MSIQPQWILTSPDPGRVQELTHSLRVPSIIAQILVNRGVTSFEGARLFLKPTLADLPDPFLLPDMDRAVERIATAIRHGEPILIYGDYDVDGVCSTALLYLVLQDLGAAVSYYVPDRLKEGYGLSETGIAEAQRRQVGLIISVDCGITAGREVTLARQDGIDTVITDHHEPGPALPEAIAVVNPKRADAVYPHDELAGVGVAFKLCQALYRFLGLDQRALTPNLDLVALGTAADIVPVARENRILLRYGLEQLGQSARPGMQALLEVSGLSGRRLGTSQVVFGLAPRINAAGRLGDATRGIRLLATKDGAEARVIARQMDRENQRRQALDEATLNEALAWIDANVDLDREKALVVAAEGWHPGVIGIVASRLVERFYRPAIVIALDEGIGKGSARSIPDFHLYQALKACADLLVRFGGHQYAAGLTVAAGQVEALRERFNQVTRANTTPDHFIPKLYLDGELDLATVDARLMRLLKYFEPFGPQNRQPVLASRGVRVVSGPYIVGQAHLKFKVASGHRAFDAIAFRMGDRLAEVQAHRDRIDLAYVLEENTWNEVTSTQLRIKDIGYELK